LGQILISELHNHKYLNEQSFSNHIFQSNSYVMCLLRNGNRMILNTEQYVHFLRSDLMPWYLVISKIIISMMKTGINMMKKIIKRIKMVVNVLKITFITSTITIRSCHHLIILLSSSPHHQSPVLPILPFFFLPLFPLCCHHLIIILSSSYNHLIIIFSSSFHHLISL